MALHFALPSTIHFDIGQETVPINAFDAKEEKQNLGQQPVNIIASGPSIAEQAISKLQSTPTIFVNGSLSLTADYDFKSVVGYVISDARFIHHRPEVLQRYYKGQSLYATVAVFEAIAATQPEMLWRYRDAMRIIYLVDRPWGVKSNKASHTKLSSKYQWLSQRKSLADFADNPNFVITDRRTSTLTSPSTQRTPFQASFVASTTHCCVPMKSHAPKATPPLTTGLSQSSRTAKLASVEHSTSTNSRRQ